MSLAIDIQSAVTCDDIRREDNGKALVIGVYVGEILVREFPVNLRLSWLLLGKNRPSGERNVELRIASDQIVMAKAEIAHREAGTDAAIILQGIPITFKEPGELTVSSKEGDEWRQLVSKKVRQGPT